VDVVDHNRALIDGGSVGAARQTIPFKRLSLTELVFNIPRSASSAIVQKKLEKEKAVEQWQTTGWAKKLQRHTVRSNLSDFDRFKVMVLRKKKAQLINREVAKLKKAGGKKSKK